MNMNTQDLVVRADLQLGEAEIALRYAIAFLNQAKADAGLIERIERIHSELVETRVR